MRYDELKQERDHLREEVRALRKALDLFSAERERFSHAVPEMSGDFFITGKGGESDSNGLPEYIFVCPSYGCDWAVTYKKADKE